jgi:hypothetical protein
MKLKLYLGWAYLVAALGVAIAILVFFLKGEPHPAAFYIRPLLVLPFCLWWGIRQIGAARQEIEDKKYEENKEESK